MGSGASAPAQGGKAPPPRQANLASQQVQSMAATQRNLQVLMKK